MSALDLRSIRADFPALARQVGGRPVIFADNAATSLRPQCVLDAVTGYYTTVSANVHRSTNVLSDEATELYEGARRTMAAFVGAEPEELVFVRNTTEAINLAAVMLGLTDGDEVVCSLGEHHSNQLPWRARARVRLVPPRADGLVDPDALLAQVTERTRLIAITHASNVTGLVQPVEDVARAARARGVPTLVDGAQSVPHLPVDVRELGCDFLAFSGHKMLGPSGVGVLFGRRELLQNGRPMLYGGGMVDAVGPDDFELAEVPHRYEAGTPCIEGAIGLAQAADYLDSLGRTRVRDHAFSLAAALLDELAGIRGLSLAPARTTGERVPIVSFATRGIEADDVAMLLCNRHNVMVRSGVHCSEPLVRHFGARGLVRVSLQVYNTFEEVAAIGAALRSLAGVLG